MNNQVHFSDKNLFLESQLVDSQLVARLKMVAIRLFRLRNNSKTAISYAFLILPFLFFVLPTPSVFGQKTAKKEVQKSKDFNGTWSGKGTVDHGSGSRTEFEYELILEQKKDGTITGVSVTFLHIGGKRYCAKALVEGKAVKTYLNCAEKYNITEDKLPESSWIPFTKMELILKNNATTLEGLYECSDGSNGRIILTRKPPQV